MSAETLRCTAGLDGGRDVNLEQALRLSDRLGGHLMSGHVDGVGTVVAFDRVDEVASGDGSFRLEIEAPVPLARFIAAKGSIAVDGVSLTVNGVAGARFHVNLIPHTLAVTTLKGLRPARGSTSKSTSSRATSRACRGRRCHGQLRRPEESWKPPHARSCRSGSAGSRSPREATRYGEVTNPATGEVIRHVPLANADDVDAAARAAKAALRRVAHVRPRCAARAF